jgi:hypothetical protein
VIVESSGEKSSRKASVKRVSLKKKSDTSIVESGSKQS